MAFARGVGEFGTVIFVTSNIPLKTEVISRHIANLLEQYDLAGATAVGGVTLASGPFALLLAHQRGSGPGSAGTRCARDPPHPHRRRPRFF